MPADKSQKEEVEDKEILMIIEKSLIHEMPVPTTQHSSSEDKLHSLHSDDWALSIWINFTFIQNTIGNGWKIFTPLCIPSPAGRAYTLFPPPTMKFFQ